ncbi:hypothetical protein BJH93_08485 [Kocuria polaris]|nr:hypothetical protein [Kocuria polaris]
MEAPKRQPVPAQSTSSMLATRPSANAYWQISTNTASPTPIAAMTPILSVAKLKRRPPARNIRKFAAASTRTEPPTPAPPANEANGTSESVRVGSKPHAWG